MTIRDEIPRQLSSASNIKAFRQALEASLHIITLILQVQFGKGNVNGFLFTFWQKFGNSQLIIVEVAGWCSSWSSS